MATIKESGFTGGAIQAFGNVASSALGAATEGIAVTTNLDQGLKLFGGFDRNVFERVQAEGKQIPPVVQNAAEYAKPAQILKEFMAGAARAHDYMVPFNDVVKNLENPQFRVSDGLASFTEKKISNTLGAAGSGAEKGIIIIGGGKPGAVSDLEEKGIIVVDGGKPGATTKLGERGIKILQDSLEKLQKMEATASQQLKLFQSLNR